jgi:hypothetical protein
MIHASVAYRFFSFLAAEKVSLIRRKSAPARGFINNNAGMVKR